MKINYKDIIQIIIISLVLSSIRYLFLDDYPIFKKTKLNEITQVVESSDSLFNFINSIQSPTLVDLKTSKMLFDKNLVTFVDARDLDSYKEQHIFSAINLPYELIEIIVSDHDLEYMIELGEDFIEKITIQNSHLFLGVKNGKFYISRDVDNIINESFSNQNFLIYCSGHGCSLSEDLGFYLYDLGIKNILIYEGGIPEWLDNKFPVSNE